MYASAARRIVPYVGFLVICALTFTSDAEIVSNPSKKRGADPLFRIKRDRKWGYMDRSGKIVITPRSDYERDFFHGLAAVLREEKFGYIDDKGAVVISPQFDDARDFRDTLAPVRLGRRWGYIDRTGRVVVKPRFQAAAEFHEGLARIYIWNKLVCPRETYTADNAPEFELLLPEENLKDSFPSCAPEGGRFGFINKNGVLVIAPRFSMASDFSEGLAAVRIGEGPDGRYGYIDGTGAFVIQPRFFHADPFSEGLAAVETNMRIAGNRIVDVRVGYIDRSGKLVIPDKYEFGGRFSEGLARAAQLGRMGYIDRSGRMVIAPQFESAWNFSNGLAPACSDGGCSYIDRSGKPVITGFHAWWEFSDGLAIVDEKRRGQVYIDTKGRVVAGFDFERN